MLKLTILNAFFFVIISMPVIVGCNHEKTKSENSLIKKDSARTEKAWALFKSAETGEPVGGVIKRVHVADTFSWKETGLGKMELKGGPDFYYLIPYNMPIIDSTGKQVKDSAGRIKFKVVEIPTDKKWVRSGFENMDSAIKELNDLK